MDIKPKVTVKTLLEEMKTAVDENQTLSPTQWLNWAFHLNVLRPDLKTELTKYEMLYKSEKAELITNGKKIGEASLIVEGKSENYRMYQYMKGRDEIVEEFIMLAKKRATVEREF